MEKPGMSDKISMLKNVHSIIAVGKGYIQSGRIIGVSGTFRDVPF